MGATGTTPEQSAQPIGTTTVNSLAIAFFPASNYLALSPVDKIELEDPWEPYKETFHSYRDDAAYNHRFSYRGGDLGARKAREFFDRLAHFSEKPDLMASSDLGQYLFERHFGAGANIVATARTTR